MEAYLSNLTVFNHPLIKHKVSHLCDVNTGTKEFSELVKELAMLMGYETLKELKTKDVEGKHNKICLYIIIVSKSTYNYYQ